MKLHQTIFYLLAFITTIHALALPSSFNALTEASKDLFKRKGGGGGGGKGGGSSSSSSSSSGSSSSSSGTKGGSGSTSGTGSTSSSSGSGSSVRPSYGSSGGYYGGGTTTPYRTGGRSTGGIAPYVLAGGALALFPGIWLYGAYAYNWPNYYTYHNNTNNQNETHPVSCWCGEYAQCGCDANNDTDYLNSVANNSTLSHVADVNGTQTLLINGTLPNATDDATTSGTSSGSTTTTGAASSLSRGRLEMSGFWVVLAGVGYTMWFM